MNKSILPILLIIGVLVVSGCTQGGDQTYTSQTDVKLARCETIQDSYSKENCIATEANDPALCEKLQNKLTKDSCYENTAIATKDIIICEKIKNRGDIALCIESIIIKTNNSNLCEKLSEHEVNGLESNKDRCYTSAAKIAEDSALCEKVQNTYKDNCYLSIAIDSKDPTICEKIILTYERNLCLNKSANETVQ